MTKPRKSTGGQPIPEAEKLRIFTAICDAVAHGVLVRDAAKEYGINPATIWKWAAEDDVLGKLYAHAKHQAADALAEEAIRIALETTNETYSADRLKVDTLKWAAAKRRPKEYGERQAIENSGEQTLNVVIRSE
jgi:transposase